MEKENIITRVNTLVNLMKEQGLTELKLPTQMISKEMVDNYVYFNELGKEVIEDLKKENIYLFGQGYLIDNIRIVIK